MQIHPFVKLFSAAILLAAAALIVPSPLIDSAQADPPPECEEWNPDWCTRMCCHEYELCVLGTEEAYMECFNDCQGDPGCESECYDAYQYNLEACEDDVDFCLFFCNPLASA